MGATRDQLLGSSIGRIEHAGFRWPRPLQPSTHRWGLRNPSSIQVAERWNSVMSVKRGTPCRRRSTAQRFTTSVVLRWVDDSGVLIGELSEQE